MFKPVFPVIEYGVNYDYISQVLCVNKDKPQMHCNGKCHLMKEMAKEAESEKPISPDKKTSASEKEILFYQALQPFESFNAFYPSVFKINAGYSNLYYFLNSHAVFHPPALA